MNNLNLLIEFHLEGKRQGPGGEQQTKLAIELAGLKSKKQKLNIADIGCGTGASTLVLAKELDATIAAVDLFPEFLTTLDRSACQLSLDHKIKTKVGSMEDLTFEQESLDLIWSEGAIYNMGFKNGISTWQKFLKRGGILAVSEITWLTASRPREIETHWTRAYPEIATASEKIKLLEDQNYKILGYFPLPTSCWLENYYEPMKTRFEHFIQRNITHSSEATQLVDNEKKEMALYNKYKNYFSYGFYIAERI